jgi:hypothetical protein
MLTLCSCTCDYVLYEHSIPSENEIGVLNEDHHTKLGMFICVDLLEIKAFKREKILEYDPYILAVEAKESNTDYVDTGSMIEKKVTASMRWGNGPPLTITNANIRMKCNYFRRLGSF